MCVESFLLSLKPAGLHARDGFWGGNPIPKPDLLGRKLRADSEYGQAEHGFVFWSSAHRRAEKMEINIPQRKALEEPHFHFVALWIFSK